MNPTPRLQQRYREQVAPKLREQFEIRNDHELPKLQKIVINVGMGPEMDGPRVRKPVREQVLHDLSIITGQKPVMVQARKSVANFKVRTGYESHAKVTLRRARMWEFLDRLINLAVPHIKDFRGLPDKSFDPAGNYAFGVTEQAIFPEVNMAEAYCTHGMNINLVIASSDPERSRFLLTELGMPLRGNEGQNAAA